MTRARHQRHKIIIQTPTRTANAYGEPVETFATFAERYAKIKSVTGREVFNGTQEVNEYPVMFSLRYDATTKAVTEKMRVSFDSKYYDIEAVVNYNELNEEIHVYAKNRGT